MEDKRRSTRLRKPVPRTRTHVATGQDSEEATDEDSQGDFEDSGSEAEVPTSDEDSADEFMQDDSFQRKTKIKTKTPAKFKKARLPEALKMLRSKKEPVRYSREDDANDFEESEIISIKDLTDQQKLLPNFLNLSESDSDDDEASRKKKSSSPRQSTSYDTLFREIENTTDAKSFDIERSSDSDEDMEDVSSNLPDENAASDIIPEHKFQHLREQTERFEEAKKTLECYEKRKSTVENAPKADVNALLALGEPESVKSGQKKGKKLKKRDLSDSDDGDWEEVAADSRPKVPKEGLQVVVDFPSNTRAKSKPVDLEMMMKRRINRVRKEYQIYMHKVHVLCWLAHGNYVNKKLNRQDVLGAALSLMPSDKAYPKDRTDIKYLEQITKWFHGMMTLKEDVNEQKVKFNRPELDKILLKQIGAKTVGSKKNLVLIFVALLRSIGIKCRMILSFVLVPIRPKESDLCSLATKKPSDKKSSEAPEKSSKKKISKPDGVDEKISQLDGADDEKPKRKRNLSTRKESAAGSRSKSPVLSYWDQITKDVIVDKDDKKRVSHRDILQNGSKISTATKRTPDIYDEDTVQINSIAPGPVLALNKATTSRSPYFSKQSNATKDKPDSKKYPKRTSSSAVSLSDKIVKTTQESDTKKYPKRASSGTKNSSDKTVNKKQKLDEKIPPKNTKATSSEAKQKRPPKKSNTKEPDIQRSPFFSQETVIEKCTSTSNRAHTIDKEKIPGRKSTLARKVKAKAIVSISKSGTESDENYHNKPKRYRTYSNSSDADFKTRVKTKPASKPIDRRVLSSDDEINGKKRGIDFWCEAYVEEEEQWISIDVIKGMVHCVNELYRRATHPVSYVVGWDENGYLKDLTRRYVSHWNTTTRKLRVDPLWYEKAKAPWSIPAHLRDRKEDEQLDRMELDAPLPTTVGEYKNHPLYALKRHLLKFEAIYPPDAMTLGFIRNEPVYARECVYICRSRDTWLKEAKIVKLGEKPYKIVKARPKYDKLSGNMITDKPLEIFGPWQCEDYVPPPAENGEVPRNAYGNVELFKPCMLPKGTVHLQLPGLNKVARKLGIDCAPAMTGFDYHSGGSHPVYDGFVICEEFKEVAIAAWEQEQEEAQQRAREKIEKRVYGNWKRLIKGLLIRERLKIKYDLQPYSVEEPKKLSKASSKK